MPPFPELKDITPPTPPPLSSPEEIQRIVWLAFAVVMGVIAIVLLWLWWRSRARHRGPPPLPLSAAEEARRRLAQLETLAPQLEAVALGHQVSEVIRHYLERQHGLLARYRTTEELLGAARNLAAPPLPFLRPFAEVLRRCDNLKFAGSVVPSTERSALVRETLAALNDPPPAPPIAPAPQVTALHPPESPTRDPNEGSGNGASPSAGLDGSSSAVPAAPRLVPPSPPPALPVTAIPLPAIPRLPSHGPPGPPALAPRRADAFTHRADFDRGTVIPS